MNEKQRAALIYGEINARYHEVAQAQGLSDSVQEILYVLRLFDNSLPLKDLVYYSVLPKQTASSALRKMREEGLVQQELIKGRKQRITLTEAGVELAKETVDKIIAAEDEMMRSWGAEQCRQYIEMGEEYIAVLQNLVQHIRDEEKGDEG